MAGEHRIVAEGRSITYTVVRSDRRTIAVSVAPDGSVCVRAPRWLPHRRIASFVTERVGWVARKQAEATDRAKRSAGPLTADETARARVLFAERAAACWRVFAQPGERMPELRVRVMRTRWGSLTASGHITLNAALVRATPEQLDYVIFHELCHLRVRGHGRDFYAELARYVPEWRRLRRELHDHPL
jgi:hypothetical protein